MFAAAEHIARTRKKSVLWVARRVGHEKWHVKMFCASLGALIQFLTPDSMSLTDILDHPSTSNVEVLVVDAPTSADDPNTSITGIKAFQWAGNP